MHESESEVAQSRPTLRDPMVCSPPGSSAHGIFQARALEWVPLLGQCGSVKNLLSTERWYFGHLMRRADSFEKILMLGKIEGRRRRGQQRMRWLDGITDSMDMS